MFRAERKGDPGSPSAPANILKNVEYVLYNVKKKEFLMYLSCSKTSTIMKKTIIFIILLLLMIAACVYYNCIQQQKFEDEKKIAVAEAVQNTIDSINQHKALEAPKQQVKAHKPPPPPQKTKKVMPEAEAVNPALLTDERDGQQYKIFEAAGLTWMGQNLNFETPGSWCYELEDANCADWGRLYTWDEATKACPDGWHLPSDDEWNALINYYGGTHYAGQALKEGGHSEFNAKYSGYRDKAGYFGKINESAYYWSSTEHPENYASFKGIYKSVDNIGTYTYPKTDGFSVRCVKDKQE